MQRTSQKKGYSFCILKCKYSCLHKLEKCGSRAVTYYNKKSQTQGGLEYKTVSDLSSETIPPCSDWHEICEKDAAEIWLLKYTMIRPKLVLKSNHQNNSLETDVSKTLARAIQMAQNVEDNAKILLPFICLAERHHLSLNTSIVLIAIYNYTIIIMTK